jgi:hypothetical protein
MAFLTHRYRGPLPASALILLGVSICFQLNAFMMHFGHLPQKPTPGKNDPFAVPQVSLYSPPLQEPEPMSRMPFTENMTFNGECQSSKLWNATWGKTVAPWVDKIESKTLVEHMGLPIKLARTITVYDANNITNFTATTMYQLPNSVIKPTQFSGHVARVHNNDYFCFKCRRKVKKHFRMDGQRSNLHLAHTEALNNMLFSLENVPLKYFAEREAQYENLTHRIIVEEYVPAMETMSEYHWWIVNGQPVFICVRCDQEGHRLGSYFSSSFRELEIGGAMDKCKDVNKPKTWDRMLSIVKKMGEQIPGVVCIDLYANDQDVYFSEFTFTRKRCETFFQPIVADALLYSMSNGLVESHLVTSDYVEKTIADRSWVHVYLKPEEPSLRAKQGLIASGYPSSLDLCRNQTVDTVANCTLKTEPLMHFPLHCVVTINNEISTIGQWKTRTVNLILARIDWRWAFGIAGLWFYLKKRANGAKKEREHHQVWNCFTYLALVVIYKSQQDHFSGLLAPTPLWNTFIQSYEIFTIVHPVTSPAIAFSHFGTYWIAIAAFRARSLRAMLIWWFCYEIVTAFVNEFFHYGEDDDSVRCMRISFIQHAKQYAINDVIRVYLLPPFFVYGYLLPKMMLHWCGFL